MHAIMFGEFMGTLILVLLGNGVVAGALLKGSKSEGAGWIVITAGWAFAVMAGVFTAAACGSSAAQLNPAITLAFVLASGDWAKVAPMIAAQLLGAFAGAALVWVHFFPHWAKTVDQEAKLACFAPVLQYVILPRISPAKRSPRLSWFLSWQQYLRRGRPRLAFRLADSGRI
jgi:glycerol uptake facilitator protein